MTHPQDVAVPSLPEPALVKFRTDDGFVEGFTADQIRAYARAAVIADRAAGRASAEPEGGALTDDELVDLGRCPTSNMPPWGIGSTRGHYLLAVRAALAAAPTPTAPEGLSLAQEPKYTVNGSAIVNRASGEAIPADEPVFIFRARDLKAIPALATYAAAVSGGQYEHWNAVLDRIADFSRFKAQYPERMNEPDTAPTPTASIAPKAEGEAKPFGLFMLHEDDGQWGAYQVSSTYANDPKAFRLYAAAPVAQAAAGALTCAGIAMAAKCEVLPLMTAIRDAGEGNVTLNQRLTTDQALQAIAALTPRPEADADRASGGGVVAQLVDALKSIRRYGLDTLSGRVDGPDDRDWQREAVNEMTKRARVALELIPPTTKD